MQNGHTFSTLFFKINIDVFKENSNDTLTDFLDFILTK